MSSVTWPRTVTLATPRMTWWRLLTLTWLAAFACCASIMLLAPVVEPGSLRGLYRAEAADAPFRWTSSEVMIPVHGWSGVSIVSVRLASGRWPQRPVPEVTFSAGDMRLAHSAVADQTRRYLVLMTPGARTLHLQTPVAQPSASDARRLGVQLHGVNAVRTGFPIAELIRTLLAACAVALLVACLPWLVRHNAFAPLLATGIALLLRLFALERLPAGFFQDEAVGVVDALNLLATGRDHYGHVAPLGAFEAFGDWVSPLLTYLQVPFVAFMGASPLAARLPGALAGALAAPAVYALARRLSLNDLAAFGAALAVAVSPWQIVRTRIASPPALVPLCWSLCLLAGVVLVQRRTRRAALMLALAAGFGLYSYPTMKMAVPLLAGLAIALAYWQEARTRRAGGVLLELVRRWWPAGVLLAVIWMPFAILTLTNENSAMRASRKLLQADSALAWMTQWFEGYSTYWRPDFYFLSGDPSNGIQGQGAELWVEAPLVLAGLAALVWRLARGAPGANRTPWLLMAGALLLAPLPASLMSPNPHLTRAVVAAPLFALLAGLGLQQIAAAIQKLERGRRIAGMLVAAAIVLALGWQGMARFDDYLRVYPALVEGKYRDGLREAVARLVALAPGYDEVWIDDGMAFPYIDVLAAGGVRPAETQATLIVDRPGTTFNTVHQVGKYRFVNLSVVPRSLAVQYANVTSLGNPGYIIQEWHDGERLVLVLRRMA